MNDNVDNFVKIFTTVIPIVWILLGPFSAYIQFKKKEYPLFWRWLVITAGIIVLGLLQYFAEKNGWGRP